MRSKQALKLSNLEFSSWKRNESEKPGAARMGEIPLIYGGEWERKGTGKREIEKERESETIDRLLWAKEVTQRCMEEREEHKIEIDEEQELAVGVVRTFYYILIEQVQPVI